MAKFQIWQILCVVLVVLAVCVHAQQQQQLGGKRKKGQLQQQQANKQRPRPGPQKQQQQQQQQQQQKQPNKKKPNKPGNGINKGDANEPQVTYVIKQIPNLGRARGRVVQTRWTGKPILQFLDIPYGKSPVGPLRFKPSVPAGPWEGTLSASKSHLGCPIVQYLPKYVAVQQKRNIDLEDCLRLSVHTKTFAGSAPVMVYIHGDFLFDGTNNEAAPGYLLEEDVVLVSVRYRLGPFGFLSTMTEDIPGNAAVSDVILALQWIQENIAVFGGDPKRVTLFGQVGGAALINIMTMSPMVPEGLFHQVIYQSGSALSPAFITDSPLKTAKSIAKLAGCKHPGKADAIYKCLRKLNTTALLDAFNQYGESVEGTGTFGGAQFVIGGPSNILPEHPGKLLAANKFKAYPTMGGSVKNAGTFILKDIYLDTFNETIIDDMLDGLGYINHIINETNGADPAGDWLKFAQEEIFPAEAIKNGSFYKMLPGLIDLCSTIPFKNPVLLSLQANAKLQPEKTYLYTFDYEGEQSRYSNREDEEGSMPFELGVSLTDDNLYLFPWPYEMILNSNKDIKIAKRMVALWTSFAATGKPRAPGIPEWPSMTMETGPYLKIAKTVSVRENYLDEYSVAVEESRMGYNMANDEFFETLVEIANEDEKNDENGDNDEDDDEDFDDNDGHGNGRGGNNVVYIANKSKRIF